LWALTPKTTFMDMNDNLPFLERIGKQLDDIIPLVDTMLDNSSVYYHDVNKGHDYGYVLGAPLHHWDKTDPKTQLLIKVRYEQFWENFKLLLPKATEEMKGPLEKSNKYLSGLIVQHHKHAPSSIAGGKQFFRQQCGVFKNYLLLLGSKESATLVVPDTNSIVEYPDPMTYRKICPGPFQFIVLPTVLSELDKLKLHRLDTFRDKVKTAIKRLKGFRTQGNVLEGVTVDKTITVKMLATDPRFEQTLPWLDKENADDRIIASLLELQLSHLSDKVIFVTADINFQNKAQMANLSFVDSDDLS
jgi:rRNA-processing protein FCF1